MIDNLSQHVKDLCKKHYCCSCPLRDPCALISPNDTKEKFDARMNAAAKLIKEGKNHE